MKVRRIHPDDLDKEYRAELLAMSYEERLLRHMSLLEKIYPGKMDVNGLDGMKVRITRGPKKD